MKFLFNRYECLSYPAIKSTFSNVVQHVSPADHYRISLFHKIPHRILV